MKGIRYSMGNKCTCYLIMVILLSPLTALCQKTDSTDTYSAPEFKRGPVSKYFIIPTALIVSGTALMLDKDADEFFISNFEVREERNENFLNFSNHVDDYLQHAPSFTAFALSVGGVKGAHNLPNQVALYLKSELLMLGVVYGLKYSVGEGRPDTGQKNSFPSGHTTQAFCAASFLSKEYGKKSIWISIGAYTAASTVGVFRVLNNRHWISDILVGAGVGILSSDIVYRTHRNKWGRGRESSSLRISPFSAFGSTGATLIWKFDKSLTPGFRVTNE